MNILIISLSVMFAGCASTTVYSARTGKPVPVYKTYSDMSSARFTYQYNGEVEAWVGNDISNSHPTAVLLHGLGTMAAEMGLGVATAAFGLQGITAAASTAVPVLGTTVAAFKPAPAAVPPPSPLATHLH
jgi:hypothetical protein